MDDDQGQARDAPALAAGAELSAMVIGLLKGVIYREGDERLWGTLLDLQARVRDYVSVLGLELVLDESEGYAFLKSRAETAEDEAAAKLPRLVARRPLSFPVSLLLALLRKKLAEFDAGGAETRLVLSRDEIVELGFLRRLKSAGGSARGQDSYEVRRILKAFVDAQWLADFDARLAVYRAQVGPDDGS